MASSSRRTNRGVRPKIQELTSARIDSIINKRISTITRGRSYRPTLMPPEYDIQPWNSATIRHNVVVPSNSAKLTGQDLFQVLHQQLGLFTVDCPSQKSLAIRVEWRIQSFAAWNLSGNFLRGCPMNFIAGKSNAGSQELANPASMGQKNMFPCIGYIYPVDHQNFVFYSEPTKTAPNSYILFLDAADSDKVEIHWKILFRGAATVDQTLQYVPSPIPFKGRVRLNDVLRDIEALVISEGTTLKTVSDTINKELDDTDLSFRVLNDVIDYMCDNGVRGGR